jgi:N-acetylglutamate synthase-like GNAT family acetyltransferase
MPRQPDPARPQPKLVAKPLKHGERAELAQALTKANLPAADVEAPGRLFWRFETSQQTLVGFGGLEVHGPDALIRSVLTFPTVRNRGIGSAIVAILEVEALTVKCADTWVITTSAGAFFSRLRYRVCARDKVPATIRATSQFTSLCPDTATVLVKRLRVTT